MMRWEISERNKKETAAVPCSLLPAAEEGTTEYSENTERLMRLGTTKGSKETKRNSREFGPGWMG
jgi:hypothetical protein